MLCFYHSILVKSLYGLFHLIDFHKSFLYQETLRAHATDLASLFLPRACQRLWFFAGVKESSSIGCRCIQNARILYTHSNTICVVNYV